MTRCLLDTGPLVAYLNAADPFHTRVANYWDEFRGRFITSSAVVTETMHFVSTSRHGPRVLSELLEACDVEVLNLSRPPELKAAVELMEQYSDIPMDFADATLVLLAEALEIDSVLTLDRRGFSTFRTRQGNAIRMVLDYG